MIPHKIGVMQSWGKENLYYTREEWKYFLNGEEVSKVPDMILWEFERADRNHDNMMNLDGKVAKVQYTQKDWYFLSYEWEHWTVILNPVIYNLK
jgi:hypothetical protein